jgi:hypothetical protein
MTESCPPTGASPGKAPPAPADLTSVLGSRGYHALLPAAAVIAFGFLAALTEVRP